MSSKSEKKEKLIDINEPEHAPEKVRKSLGSFLARFRINRSSGKKTPASVSPKIIFLILAVVCVALIAVTAVNDRFAEPFRTAASYIIIPLERGINTIGLEISKKTDVLKSKEELVEEIESLKDEVSGLRTEISMKAADEAELNRLRRVLDLKNAYTDYPTMSARVISKDSSKWFSSFTIDRGSDDGIEKNMNVICENGLVGIITQTGPGYSTVRTIINDSSNVSATIADKGDIFIVSGNLSLMNDGLISFYDLDAEAEIASGLTVVTSNVSSVYLPGLLIGYVGDYSTDGSKLTQSGTIIPAAGFDDLTEVLVITRLKETYDFSAED